MNFQKFMTLLFSLIFFVFLTLVTYVLTTNNYQSITLNDTYIGLKEIISKDDNKFDYLEVNEVSAGKDFIDNLSLINRTYLSLDKLGIYKKTTNKEKTFINIDKGVFIFDLYDLSQDYYIENKYFSINQKSPGKIFVDARDENKIKFFSFDSVLNLKIKENNKQVTQIFLYPKMLLSLSSSKIKYLTNADFYRLQSILSGPNYTDFNLDLKSDIDSKLILALSLNSGDKKVGKIFQVIIDKTKISNLDSSNNILTIKNKKIYGFNYINKYFFAFLNEQKKAVYYKKNVINLLTDYNFSSDKDEQIKIISEMETSLVELKKIDEKSFNEMFNVLVSFYDILLKTPDLSYLDKSIDFLKFLQKNYSYQSGNNITQSYFYLSKVLSLMNSDKIESTKFKESLKNFIEYYKNQNNIVVSNNLFLSNKVGKTLKIDNQHFKEIQFKMFFLQSILKNKNIDFFEYNGLSSMLQVLDTYIQTNFAINQFMEKTQNENYKTNSESLVLIIYDLTDKLMKNAIKTYFQEERDDGGLLQFTENKALLKAESLDKWNQIFTQIFAFLEKNKINLSPKNKYYEIKINSLKKVYDEYILALTNESKYKLTYSKINKELFGIETIGEQNLTQDFSKDDVLNYIKKFNELDLSHISIEKKDKGSFDISNIVLFGKTLNFNLNVDRKYQISDIKYNNNELSQSYYLSDVEKKYQEALETASDEDRNKYNFGDFFVNIFEEKQDDNFVVESKDEVKKDTPIIAAFKREKLFSKRGEFEPVKEFLKLTINNVIVEITGTNYNISIDKADFKFLLQSDKLGDDLQIVGILSSKYLLSNTLHNFSGISMTIFDPEADKGQQLPLYGNSTFKLGYDVYILDLEKTLKQMFIDFEVIKGFYDEILYDTGLETMDIIYKKNRSFDFQYSLDGQKIIKNIKIQD